MDHEEILNSNNQITDQPDIDFESIVSKEKFDSLKPSDTFKSLISEGVTLNVWPRTRVSWDDLRKNFPAYSIALDGFVTGPPVIDKFGPYRNFNHHEGVDRDGTRCTASQVHFALKRGLTRSFKNNGSLYANLFVEDCDQDVCVSCWLLANHERVVGEHSEPLINRMIYNLDLQDTAAGMYPQDPSSKIMREMKWIFNPYIEARKSGLLNQMPGSDMFNLINAVMTNITQYTLGNGQTMELDTNYEVIGGGSNWSMTIEKGYEARAAYVHNNIFAFVSVIENQDSSYSYSIGIAGPYDNFPLQHLFDVLNKHEDTPCWGGSDTIGGSRGGNGSSLKPEEVEKIINDGLAFLVSE